MDAYLYQYLVGGTVFAAGMIVAWRTGQLGLRAGRPRRRLLVLLGGLVFFATLQAGLLLLDAVLS